MNNISPLHSKNIFDSVIARSHRAENDSKSRYKPSDEKEKENRGSKFSKYVADCESEEIA